MPSLAFLNRLIQVSNLQEIINDMNEKLLNTNMTTREINRLKISLIRQKKNLDNLVALARKSCQDLKVPEDKEKADKFLQQVLQQQSPPKPKRSLPFLEPNPNEAHNQPDQSKIGTPPEVLKKRDVTPPPIAAKKSPVVFTQAGTKEVQLVTANAKFTEITSHSQDKTQTKVSYLMKGPSLRHPNTRQEVLMEMIFKLFEAGKFQSGLLLKGTKNSVQDTVRAIYALYPNYKGKICVTNGTEVAVLNGKENEHFIAWVKKYAGSPDIQTLKKKVIRQVNNQNEENDEDSLSTTSPRLH